MKVDFYVLGQKGYTALLHFCEKNGCRDIGAVIAARDAAIENDYFNEIENFCSAAKIAFYERSMIKESVHESTYAFAIGWRWIINTSLTLVVFHDSLLPKYRGFAPLVNMLINQEEKIGVTALIASDEYDKGDIVAQSSIAIEYPIKIQKAIDLMSVVYGELVNSVYRLIKRDGSLRGQRQDEASATYSLWRNEDDYFINWEWDSGKIERFCNALGYPYKGARTLVGNEVLIINEVMTINDVAIESRHDHIGKIIFLDGDNPVVVCGSGLIKLTSYSFQITEEKKLPFRTRFKSIS